MNTLVNDRTLKKLFTFVMILSVLASCTLVHQKIPVPKITFENGYNDSYSSKINVFRRQTCTDENYKKKAVIPKSELIQIGNIAKEIGFFNLPSDLPMEPENFTNGMGRIFIIGGCSSYSLRIQYGNLENTVTWNCNHESNPKSIMKLLKPLKEKLYNLRTVKEAPESQCVYY